MTGSVFRGDVLAGRVAFITGGSSGINKAIARRYVEHGARVVLVARDPAKLEIAAAELDAVAAGSAAGFAADVRDLTAVEAAARAGCERFGRYDVVIAGAAGNFPAPAARLSSNGFAAVVDIDLKGTFHTFRACHPWLNPGARLIAISAPQAQVPMEYQAAACSAKAGIEMLVRTLALEWGGLEGTRVNALSPGLVAGTYGAEIFLQHAGEAAMVGAQPVPRLATLQEVADAAVFLASPLGDYITGHVLAVDGGLSLASATGLAFRKAIEAAAAARPA
jgi:NAD(P)-dependent dehydrogenase (short-subunit alcohol dehydrogenase family)